MIKQEVVDKILDTARIEEVVGDFVDLKKRGTSLIGLCPFHNEKSPSFHVSVSKGIYKCFGCGAGGDPVRFIMEHEKYSYPEALRFLATKYHIEVEETQQTDEQLQIRDHRESLLVVTGWAGTFFTKSLWETTEGQNIGLQYFRERGFRDDIVKKFELGYSPEGWSTLLDQARSEGYNDEYLEETGLIIKKDDNSAYDRFRGRVMFPIHNLTGRVLGFGGRTLKTEKSVPKYVNSPESPIYHKSDVLYGLFQAKKAISQQDKCYLVEGYADVIAMHQAGAENVVSSSGTSLTSGQIRLISRYTKQVTILYDGDAAGIKASLRGTDMLLEEGLNVKILLFPDGDDPDSYIKKHGSTVFKTYLSREEEDFISFKTKILLKESGNDPIKRAETIRTVVESIALIPDEIKVSVYIQECSALLDIEERVLLHELNKIRIAQRKKPGGNPASSGNYPTDTRRIQNTDSSLIEPGIAPGITPNEKPIAAARLQEQELVRVLLHYGDMLAEWEPTPDLPIAPLLLNSIEDVPIEDETCSRIIHIYKEHISRQQIPEPRIFTSHNDPGIADLSVSLLSSKYILSPNWNDDKRNIYVPEEKENLEELVYTTVYRIKKRWIEGQIEQIREELKDEKDEANLTILIKKYQTLRDALKIIGEKLGTIIVK